MYYLEKFKHCVSEACSKHPNRPDNSNIGSTNGRSLGWGYRFVQPMAEIGRFKNNQQNEAGLHRTGFLCKHMLNGHVWPLHLCIELSRTSWLSIIKTRHSSSNKSSVLRPHIFSQSLPMSHVFQSKIAFCMNGPLIRSKIPLYSLYLHWSMVLLCQYMLIK